MARKKYDTKLARLKHSNKEESRLLQILSVDTRGLICQNCQRKSIAKRGDRLICLNCGEEYLFETKDIYNKKMNSYNPYNQRKNSRNNERHTESWSVRGHERHYSDGKVVYVNPYMKGKIK